MRCYHIWFEKKVNSKILMHPFDALRLLRAGEHTLQKKRLLFCGLDLEQVVVF